MQQSRNVASKAEIKKQKKEAKSLRERELADIKAVLELPEGRRFLWRVLSRCNVFGSVWEPSAKIHYNAGQQDMGHFLMAEVLAADEQIFFNMMTENKHTGDTNEQ